MKKYWLLLLLLLAYCGPENTTKPLKPGEAKPEAEAPIVHACYINVKVAHAVIFDKCIEVYEDNKCTCLDHYCYAVNDKERYELPRSGEGNIIINLVWNEKCKPRL